MTDRTGTCSKATARRRPRGRLDELPDWRANWRAEGRKRHRLSHSELRPPKPGVAGSSPAAPVVRDPRIDGGFYSERPDLFEVHHPLTEEVNDG